MFKCLNWDICFSVFKWALHSILRFVLKEGFLFHSVWRCILKETLHSDRYTVCWWIKWRKILLGCGGLYAPQRACVVLRVLEDISWSEISALFLNFPIFGLDLNISSPDPDLVSCSFLRSSYVQLSELLGPVFSLPSPL